MPSSVAARITRMAISPRLATSSLRIRPGLPKGFMSAGIIARAIGARPENSSRMPAALVEAAGREVAVLVAHDDDAVAALVLGAVERFVGELDQPDAAALGLRLDMPGTDTDGKPSRIGRGLVRNIEFCNQALHARQHIGDVIRIRVIQHD